MVYCHLNWVPRRLELRSPLKAGPVVDMLAGSAEIRYCGDKGLSMADSPPLLTLQPELFTLLLEASRNTFLPSPRSMCRKNVGNKPDSQSLVQCTVGNVDVKILSLQTWDNAQFTMQFYIDLRE